MRRCVVARVLPDVPKKITAIIFMGQDSSWTSRSCGWRHCIPSKSRGPFHAMKQCHFWRKGTSHTERVLLGLLSPVAATHVTCFNIKIVCILPTACSHFAWLSYPTANDLCTWDSSVLPFRYELYFSISFEPRTSRTDTSQYASEGSATGHLDTWFSCFSSVFKQTQSFVTTFQVANACVPCSSPDVNVPTLIPSKLRALALMRN